MQSMMNQAAILCNLSIKCAAVQLSQYFLYDGIIFSKHFTMQ